LRRQASGKRNALALLPGSSCIFCTQKFHDRDDILQAQLDPAKRKMKLKANLNLQRDHSLPKCPTGIAGFDEITLGGLPRGRPSLICGGAGCGKTLFGMEFLARGAKDFDEPGVCISFEETSDDLAQNAISLGFDLKALERSKKLIVDYIHIDKSEIAETGEYDL